MQVHHDFSALPVFRNPVVTIGTFDGVHSGHKALLKRIRELANQNAGETVLLTFYPHPRMVLYPDDHRVSLLSSPEEKIEELQAAGLDHLVVYPFSTELSRLSAFEYVRDFLVKGINAHTVVVGHDHRFGRNREGDFKVLLEFSEVFGFSVHEISALEIDNIEISSTKIRSALERGDVKEATTFLGRPYAITGTVFQNRQLGSQLGFPTANIQSSFEHKLVPVFGVYIVKVQTPFGIFNGVTNIGIRPTVESNGKVHIETHIFEFDKNLYGQTITLQFFNRLRGEQKFNSKDELINAINEDCRKAKEWFLEHS